MLALQTRDSVGIRPEGFDMGGLYFSWDIVSILTCGQRHGGRPRLPVGTLFAEAKIDAKCLTLERACCMFETGYTD